MRVKNDIQSNMTALFSQSRLLPIVNIQRIEDTLPLLDALSQAGVKAVELTLRHRISYEVVALACKTFPQLAICVGTLLQVEDIPWLAKMDIACALSPGFCPHLLAACQAHGLCWLPAAATPSEVLAIKAAGLGYCKLFPAELLGGVAWLKALQGPFPEMRFLATGGVSQQNASAYLQQSNVCGVGSSAWINDDDIAKQRWQHISDCLRTFLLDAKKRAGQSAL